jgi:hypothetical protein
MEAINLRKQMAMGKGYPTSMSGSGKDPAPTPAKPTGTAKQYPKMTKNQAPMPAKRATSGG